MTTYREVDDIAEIGRLNSDLARTLQSLSVTNVQKTINPIAVPQPNTTYLFEGGLWWSYRLYPRPPQVATQYNNLFGYGSEGTHSNIEVNFPVGKFRRGKLQGAFVRNLDEANSILLAHRGGVQYDRRSFSVLDAMEKMGASVIRVSGQTYPLIRVCSIHGLQLRDIIEFVRNIIHVKRTAFD